MKKRIIFLIIIFIVIFITIILLSNKNENCECVWIDENESLIGQSRLFVKDKNGNYVDGKATITYLNGNSEEIKVSKNGELFVRKIIIDVKSCHN